MFFFQFSYYGIIISNNNSVIKWINLLMFLLFFFNFLLNSHILYAYFHSIELFAYTRHCDLLVCALCSVCSITQVANLNACIEQKRDKQQNKIVSCVHTKLTFLRTHYNKSKRKKWFFWLNNWFNPIQSKTTENCTLKKFLFTARKNGLFVADWFRFSTLGYTSYASSLHFACTEK